MALQSVRLAAEVADRALGNGSCTSRFLSRYDRNRARCLSGRYRLQRLIQTVLGQSRVADFTAGRLREHPWLAGRLMEVIGDLRSPSALLMGPSGIGAPAGDV